MRSRVYLKEEAPSFTELFEAFKKSLVTHDGGAIVTFSGIVREDAKRSKDGVRTNSIHIETIDNVADDALQSIASKIESRSGIIKVVIIHLTGTFYLGEPMVYVFVCGSHRQEAFKALEDVVDMYKAQAPLWKKETFTDGTSEWVHPH